MMEAKSKATLKLEDGKSLEMPVYGGTIGPDAVDIRALYGKTGAFTYDPGFLSTASCACLRIAVAARPSMPSVKLTALAQASETSRLHRIHHAPRSSA